MVEAANHNLQALGQAPIGVLLADAGYYSDANVRSLDEASPELLIASRNDCNRRAAGAAPRGRIPAGLSVRERMRRTLTTKRGRRLYDGWMIEPVFGQIKENAASAASSERFQRLRQRVETIAASTMRKLPSSPDARPGRPFPLSEARPALTNLNRRTVARGRPLFKPGRQASTGHRSSISSTLCPLPRAGRFGQQRTDLDM